MYPLKPLTDAYSDSKLRHHKFYSVYQVLLVYKEQKYYLICYS